MFKNIRLFNIYKQILAEHRDEMAKDFNIRIDRVGRMYTVINLPPQVDTYGPKDGPRITKTLLQNWLNQLDNYLIKIGIKELTVVEELTEIDEMNYLLIIRYKMLNIPTIATATVITGYVIGGITVATTIVLLLIKLFTTIL